MIVGEYGIPFRLGVNYDLSAATSLTLVFTKPDRSTLSVTNPDVSVGSLPINTNVGNFAANTYVTYTFQSGDVDQHGQWSVRLTYEDASPKRLYSKISHFTIAQNA